jgi:hypothetical protein
LPSAVGGRSVTQLRLGQGVIVLGHAHGMRAVPDRRHSIYVSVPDPDEHNAPAEAARTEITCELTDEPCGSRAYSARAPRGDGVVVRHLQSA